MKQFLEYAESRSEEILATLRHMVEMESFTADKASTDLLGGFIKERFEQLGARVRLVPQKEVGDHLVVDVGEGDQQVLILCHMDTVWPTGTIQERPFRMEHGLAYGPGILDMKAGIAIAFYALETLQAHNVDAQQRVRIIVNSDEEVGSGTSRQLIEDEAKNSAQVYCLEPGAGKEGALKTGRKGVGMFHVRVTGRAAHAGNEPEKGISAVEEMAHQILRLHSLANLAGGTTVNVGVVQGGSVRNQVAAFAEAMVDLRVTNMREAERVENEILNSTPVLPGASVEVSGGLNRPPMERTESTALIVNSVQRLADPLGIVLSEAQVGGGSDAQFAAAVGAPVLDGLGGVGEGPHADHEYVVVAELPRRVALLASILAGK